MRVAILGGGMAGVATAWLLDQEAEVVLFERHDRLGGHCQTVPVTHGGETHAIDLGAQLFGPRLHPTFVRFLTELGIYDPRDPDSGGTITRPMGMTISDEGAPRPSFVSPMFWQRLWPLTAPWNATGQLGFFAFERAARRFEAQGDWGISLGEWLRTVPRLSARARERLVLPWLAALAGCSIATARTFSARAAVAVASRGLPDQLLSAYTWSNARIGLGGVVELVARSCQSLTVHTSAEVTALDRGEEGLHVRSTHGHFGPFDAVVVAAPPHASLSFLAATRGLGPAVEVLRRFRYFPSRLVLHTDPVYMPADRRHWSSYNAVCTDGYCEGSIWFGAIRDRTPDGTTLDLFKSWATARRTEPRDLLHEVSYQHPLIDPDFIAAQGALEAQQGRGGVWFAGSYCRDVDLQETALLSAIRVAEGLGKGAGRRARLQPRATPAPD